MVEYAVIAGTILIAIAMGVAVLQPLLSASVGSTLQGMNSHTFLK